MAIRSSEAVWEGDIRGGKGTMKLGSGAWEGQYNFSSRFEEGKGTNPEELIAAAEAGCFSMALSGALGRNETPPTRIETTAKVHIEPAEVGFHIPLIEVTCTATVPGIDDAEFQRIAHEVKQTCPVSRVLATAEITLEAQLQS
jgi:osmotically inducible protein OsmC